MSRATFSTNQKQNQNQSCLPRVLLLLASSSDWFIALSASVVIGQWLLWFGFNVLDWKPLYLLLDLWWPDSESIQIQAIVILTPMVITQTPFLTEAPQINITCQGSKRWLKINWTPPPMTYDILTGYKIWYWSEFFNWSNVLVEREVTSHNLTDLGEYEKVSIYNIALIYSSSPQENRQFNFGAIELFVMCQNIRGLANKQIGK